MLTSGRFSVISASSFCSSANGCSLLIGLCSQAVRLALEEKGISWKSRPIILNELVREGDNFKPEYLRINPKGWYLPLFITASPFTTAG